MTTTYGQPAELVLASTQSDLTADAPTGARITARPGPVAVPSPGSVLGGAKASPLVGHASSKQGTVGGQPEVTVEFSQRIAGVTETIRTMVASLPGGRAYVFTLEAPQAAWDQFQLSFATALSGVSFDLAAVPRPG